MAGTSVGVGENHGVRETRGSGQLIRVILADTQAIFRAGLRKIFALEDDIRVVGQAETLPQTQSAVTKFSADVLIFESALAANPVEAVTELLRQAPEIKIVVVTPASDEQLTLDLFRRGAHGILSREVEPEVLVDCLRKVAAGEPWLENQAVHWVMEAFRGHNLRPSGARPKVQLTPKETLIVSCVTQGMKNNEIALYCLNHHVVDGVKPPPIPPSAVETDAAPDTDQHAAIGASAGASNSGTPAAPSNAKTLLPITPEKFS